MQGTPQLGRGSAEVDHHRLALVQRHRALRQVRRHTVASGPTENLTAGLRSRGQGQGISVVGREEEVIGHDRLIRGCIHCKIVRFR